MTETNCGGPGTDTDTTIMNTNTPAAAAVIITDINNDTDTDTDKKKTDNASSVVVNGNRIALTQLVAIAESLALERPELFGNYNFIIFS